MLGKPRTDPVKLNKMKKVLVLSYFFPPANFVGADRTAAWYNHLPKFGVYPIIITRHWNEEQTNLTNRIQNNKLEVTKTTISEIHRLPFKNSLRDKLSLYPSFFLFQKALTFLEQILSNYFLCALPYSNFYRYTLNYLDKNKDVKVIIASGRPFQSFFIGYLLKIQYPHIVWIPDYRDEWNTEKLRDANTILRKIIQKLEKRSEVKWTSNADFFLSVSDSCVSSISRFINKKGFTIMNGYDELKQNVNIKAQLSNELTISYIGTLYPYQEIEILINAVINLYKNHGYSIKLKLIGITVVMSEANKVRTLFKGYEHLFEIIERISKKELEKYYAESDILLITAYKNITTWHPVKLFEYYQYGIPILLCPSDNGSIEQFIVQTNAGYIAKTIQECEEILEDLILKKKKKESIGKLINYEKAELYSRQYQNSILSNLIKQCYEE